MAIDKKHIEDIANLARLTVNQHTAAEATDKINDIVAMVEQMSDVDTDNVEPMANPLDAVQRLRADRVTESDQRESFQKIAPTTAEGLYLVPQVID